MGAPIRVKVYGLFPRTRRRYLTESFLGLSMAALLGGLWWLGWPTLRQRLDQLELPAVGLGIKMVLQKAPWILLGAGLLKLVEMGLVLRCFARQETADSTAHCPSEPLT